MATAKADSLSGHPLRIPPLACPFPRAVNPHVDEVDRDTLAWLAASGMIAGDQFERFRIARYGWLGARTYPYASRELCQLVTDWCVWLFAFDDAYCESDRRAAEIARALPQLYTVVEDAGGGDAVEDVFARALLGIKTRIAAHATPDQLDRWRTTTKDYLFAQVWEAANREDDVLPTIDDYVFMRRRTGAMLTVFALIDVAAGVRLTVDEWLHPAVHEMTGHANDVVVWDNDLISYAKERGQANIRNNLVSVLAGHTGCGVQEAMNRIGVMRDEAVAAMVALTPATEALGSPAVDAYVRGLKFWVSGSVDYSLTSSRYAGAWQ
ncbi:4-epi-cubebol synthase [Microbispora sp. H10670]|uniref:4-epi-cubebol synthase n=1 Tax=Microbispora sp. H10670 TaxID=2729108 RepID=UPI001602AE9A|nr:4-epi-cubebol synthase [Microbispora sp. H10670]